MRSLSTYPLKTEVPDEPLVDPSSWYPGTVGRSVDLTRPRHPPTLLHGVKPPTVGPPPLTALGSRAPLGVLEVLEVRRSVWYRRKVDTPLVGTVHSDMETKTLTDDRVVWGPVPGGGRVFPGVVSSQTFSSPSEVSDGCLVPTTCSRRNGHLRPQPRPDDTYIQSASVRPVGATCTLPTGPGEVM